MIKINRAYNGANEKKLGATPTGFEPVRAKHTRLAGEPLNHSGKVSKNRLRERKSVAMLPFYIDSLLEEKKKTSVFPIRDSNPGRMGENHVS